jgi:peptide/nickel transport system permease protein
MLIGAQSQSGANRMSIPEIRRRRHSGGRLDSVTTASRWNSRTAPPRNDRPQQKADRGNEADSAAPGIMGATQLGVAVPNFWFAMLLVLVFAVNLRWFSAGGFPGWSAGFLEGIQALTLPAIALALPQASILARVMRSSLIDTLGEDFIRTARAKGLTRGQALRRHALRNALIPVLTIVGLQFSFLLAGAIIIENVFFLPGLGRLIFQAIAQRDLIVVKSVVLLLVAAVVLVTFAVDLAYAAIDPRLRRRSP